MALQTFYLASTSRILLSRLGLSLFHPLYRFESHYLHSEGLYPISNQPALQDKGAEQRSLHSLKQQTASRLSALVCFKFHDGVLFAVSVAERKLCWALLGYHEGVRKRLLPFHYSQVVFKFFSIIFQPSWKLNENRHVLYNLWPDLLKKCQELFHIQNSSLNRNCGRYWRKHGSCWRLNVSRC